MPDFEKISREFEKNGTAQTLRQIADSPEGRRLSSMLDAKAVEEAAKTGDTQALQAILKEVLRTGEGKALAKKLQDALGKK